ncbi:MAG: RDD family protein [Candidatus Dormibacteraeota bacterium]|nr:RDD family protein [Candidatus Dormibacteraeota bacterium]
MVAYIIDFFILSLAGFAVSLVLALILIVTNPADPQTQADRLRPVSNLIGLALSVGYFAGLWAYMGSTLGQRILKLRVVDANTGQPIGAGKALLRYVGLFISFLACFIGVIWVAIDGRKQGWADKIAGTVVLLG